MESEIRQLLDKIRHPESEQGIVTAGSVERIEASPERIFVALRFAKARDPFAAKRLNPVYISDNQNLTISMVMI